MFSNTCFTQYMQKYCTNIPPSIMHTLYNSKNFSRIYGLKRNTQIWKFNSKSHSCSESTQQLASTVAYCNELESTDARYRPWHLHTDHLIIRHREPHIVGIGVVGILIVPYEKKFYRLED